MLYLQIHPYRRASLPSSIPHCQSSLSPRPIPSWCCRFRPSVLDEKLETACEECNEKGTPELYQHSNFYPGPYVVDDINCQNYCSYHAVQHFVRYWLIYNTIINNYNILKLYWCFVTFFNIVDFVFETTMFLSCLIIWWTKPH